MSRSNGFLHRLLLRPELLLVLGVLGALLSLALSFFLIWSNADVVPYISLRESGCTESEGFESRVQGDFLARDILLLEVTFTGDISDQCIVEFDKWDFSAPSLELPSDRSNPRCSVPSRTSEDQRWAEFNSKRGGDIAFVAICLYSESFSRNFENLEYYVVLGTSTGEEADGIAPLEAEPEYEYVSVGSEWYAKLPAAAKGVRIRVMNDGLRSIQQSALFVLAAIFGASASAIFETLLAFGHRSIIERIANASDGGDADASRTAV